MIKDRIPILLVPILFCMICSACLFNVRPVLGGDTVNFETVQIDQPTVTVHEHFVRVNRTPFSDYFITNGLTSVSVASASRHNTAHYVAASRRTVGQNETIIRTEFKQKPRSTKHRTVIRTSTATCQEGLRSLNGFT